MEIYTSTEKHSQAANDRVYSMLWGVEATVELFRCECLPRSTTADLGR